MTLPNNTATEYKGYKIQEQPDGTFFIFAGETTIDYGNTIKDCEIIIDVRKAHQAASRTYRNAILR